MKLKQILAILFTIILWMIFCASVNAQQPNQAMQKAVQELSDQSDLVVVGKVASINSQWNKDKSRIYTNVTVDVDEFVKGNASSRSIVVRHLGGEVGSVGELYSFAPRFKSNEEVMLFLHKNKSGEFNVTNGAKGKFRIKEAGTSQLKTLESGVSVQNIKTIIKSKAGKR